MELISNSIRTGRSGVGFHNTEDPRYNDSVCYQTFCCKSNLLCYKGT